MLGLAETVLFYLLVGGGVGAAVLLRDDDVTPVERCFRVLTAVLFWPVYVPALLQPVSGNERSPVANEAVAPKPARPRDDLDDAIEQVEAELDTALRSLGGWAEGVLAGEGDRFCELRATWRMQADRIRELDALLEQPEFATEAATEAAAMSERGHRPEADRLRHAAHSRRENIARLQAIRRQMHGDLLGTLAWVRELVTMIHLAKFTGAPASRAEELVAQIAAAVHGLTEVAEWQEEPLEAV
jgi:hypothetical protein